MMIIFLHLPPFWGIELKSQFDLVRPIVWPNNETIEATEGSPDQQTVEVCFVQGKIVNKAPSGENIK